MFFLLPLQRPAVGVRAPGARDERPTDLGDGRAHRRDLGRVGDDGEHEVARVGAVVVHLVLDRPRGEVDIDLAQRVRVRDVLARNAQLEPRAFLMVRRLGDITGILGRASRYAYADRPNASRVPNQSISKGSA